MAKCDNCDKDCNDSRPGHKTLCEDCYDKELGDKS